MIKNLQPDLNGALFFWWLSGAEATRKKSGSGRRKCLPKKSGLLSLIYQRSGLLFFFYSNLILNFFTATRNRKIIIPKRTRTCFQTTSKPVPLIIIFFTIS